MKAILLILALCSIAAAQDIKQIEQIKDWKLIKEMSGEIPDHPGLTMEFRAAQIARGGPMVKLAVRLDFPDGAPWDLFKNAAPFGFDVSSISRIVGKIEFNCDTATVRPVNETSYMYQFTGKRHKSKEPPFTLTAGHVFTEYFCERGNAPTKAPTLKP